MRLRVIATALVGTLLAALTGVVAGSAQAAQQDGWTVVVRGLNNPRQLSVTPLGNLLVAEAGTGGSHCVPDGQGEETCVGASGSISRVPSPSTSRPATRSG